MHSLGFPQCFWHLFLLYLLPVENLLAYFPTHSGLWNGMCDRRKSNYITYHFSFGSCGLLDFRREHLHFIPVSPITSVQLDFNRVNAPGIYEPWWCGIQQQKHHKPAILRQCLRWIMFLEHTMYCEVADPQICVWKYAKSYVWVQFLFCLPT